MPRRSLGPVYYPSKKAWFATVNKETFKLLEASNKKASRDEAQAKYDALKKVRSTEVQGDRGTVGGILNAYLAHARDRVDKVSSNTYDLRAACIRDLLTFELAGVRVGDMAYRDLKYAHLEEWVRVRQQEGRKVGRKKTLTTWSANHARLQLTILRTAFRWAAGEGDLVSESVFARKGKAARMPEKDLTLKRLAITEAEHRALWERARRRTKGNFADMLELLHATGARPAEMYLARADEWDKDRQSFVIDPTDPRNEGRLKNRRHLKKQGKKRVIRVPDALVETVERLVRANPDGNIFRKEDGTEWAKGRMGTKIIADRFKSLVRAANEHAPGSVRPALSLYSYRHGFVTRALTAGETVPALCEHLNTSMDVIQAHYSHLMDNHQPLLDLVNRMSSPQAPRLQIASSDDRAAS